MRSLTFPFLPLHRDSTGQQSTPSEHSNATGYAVRWIVYGSNWLARFAIGINLALWFGTCIWLLRDGYVSRIPWSEPADGIEPLPDSLASWRLWTLGLLVAGCFLSWLAILWGMLFASASYRNLRRMFGLTLSVGLWLIVGTEWRSMVEFGRVARLKREHQAVELFSSSLNSQWDEVVDSSRPHAMSDLIPFNAYPIRKPTMLLFLGEQPIPGTNLTVRSIERTPEQAIRFELSGEHLGHWLEVRWNHTPPNAFETGIEEQLSPANWTAITPNLYRVQYR